MPKPLALCIEQISPPTSPRYMRCVATVGSAPGLGLDAQAQTVWETERPLTCELWVSGDDRLILFRCADSPEVVVCRAGRSLVAPCGKPVVLVDQDEVEIGGRRVRIHVHGQTSSPHPPSPLPERNAGSLKRIAAAVAIGASAAGCPSSNVQVLDHPPKMTAAPEPLPSTSGSGAPPAPTETANPPSAPDAGPIEVRERPPDMMPVEPHK